MMEPVLSRHWDQIAFAGFIFDQLGTEAICVEVEAADPKVYRYLVTPNVDHAVRMHRPGSNDAALRRAYTEATWCVCDSRVLARLARLRGAALQVAPGSDITQRLLDRLEERDDRRTIAVVGLAPPSFAALAARYASLVLVHIDAPYGLANDPAARTSVCNAIGAHDPALVLLAVGSPQQELIALELAVATPTRGTALCVGASLDFLIGREQRAPLVVQRLGIEWAFRLLQNPRRLWRRYLYDGSAIFAIAWRSRAVRLSATRR